jgi:hypothetical protein
LKISSSFLMRFGVSMLISAAISGRRLGIHLGRRRFAK